MPFFISDEGAMFSTLLEYRYLIPLALVIGLSPFYPVPHLVEKLQMLRAGTLQRPLDIFDLVWHAWPLVLLGGRLGVDIGQRLISKQQNRT
jgi:hypothetical protein